MDSFDSDLRLVTEALKPGDMVYYTISGIAKNHKCRGKFKEYHYSHIKRSPTIVCIDSYGASKGCNFWEIDRIKRNKKIVYNKG